MFASAKITEFLKWHSSAKIQYAKENFHDFKIESYVTENKGMNNMPIRVSLKFLSTLKDF